MFDSDSWLVGCWTLSQECQGYVIVLGDFSFALAQKFYIRVSKEECMALLVGLVCWPLSCAPSLGFLRPTFSQVVGTKGPVGSGGWACWGCWAFSFAPWSPPFATGTALTLVLQVPTTLPKMVHPGKPFVAIMLQYVLRCLFKITCETMEPWAMVPLLSRCLSRSLLGYQTLSEHISSRSAGVQRKGKGGQEGRGVKKRRRFKLQTERLRP